MKRVVIVFAAVALATSLSASSQQLSHTATQPLQLPADTFLGAVAGAATSSNGHVYVFTRNGTPMMTLGGARAFARGGSRLYEFDASGKFVKEIGKNAYGILAAQAVRVDAQDNIWAVDAYSNMVIKFAPSGRHLMLLGRKPEAIDVPAAENKGRGTPPGAGQPSDLFEMPTDVAWDAQGNIFVADGLGNARVAKFDKDGVFVKSWGARGSEQGQFSSAKSIAVDAAGNVYVADPGNRRIQVFDNNGNFTRQIGDVGAPGAICITPGPHQYLFSSNSNPLNDLDSGGEIYKLELAGTVLGRFGRAGKQPGEFGTVNQIDCRSASELYVAEMGNWRVQKVSLRP
jgi:DNA-binding beta-propeller fold protein YncE